MALQLLERNVKEFKALAPELDSAAQDSVEDQLEKILDIIKDDYLPAIGKELFGGEKIPEE